MEKSITYKDYITKEKISIFKDISETINRIKNEDKACKSKLEILMCYRGLHAVFLYRIAHKFYKVRMYLIARIISTISAFLTGIDIHPGAVIGRRLFIDHGTGTIIGETAIIGDDCLIYHGVTLGATGNENNFNRHPIIMNKVMIGSGAKILGRIIIGNNVKIGANAIITKNIPDNKTVIKYNKIIRNKNIGKDYHL